MKSASLGEKGYALLMFLAVSVLSGLLLAGLAAPLTTLAGSGAKAAAASLEDIPAEFETPPQSERSRLLTANGQVLATFFNENRVYVPLSEISVAMQDAQIAIEDHRFYEHGAIDFEGFGRAFVKTLTGDTQGASTLTQQYVKLVRVEKASAAGDKDGVLKATEVSIERKIVEARYAMAVEEQLTKDEILERYLNIAYYGNGAYGVEAAAQHYFGTTAKELDLAQSALLAGLVQNPVQLNPVRHTQRAINRRDTVLNRMAELGIISAAQLAEAKAVVFDPEQVTRTPNGCAAATYPFLCDYVQRTLLTLPSMGDTVEERRNLLNRGGLTIRTLIDPAAQASAEAAVAEMIAPEDPVLSSVVLIQPRTGLIVAMAQSRPRMGNGPGETFYNINVQESMGGLEGFQAGSTFKPFTMAAALDQGYTPEHRYDSPARLEIDGEEYRNCEGPFPVRADRPVSNYNDRNYGRIDMAAAIEQSVNTYFMQLIQDVGICATTEMAAKAGAKLANGDPMTSQASFPSFTLGTADVTPLSMAEAYATFANRGIHCTPIILQSVHTKDGTELETPSGNCEQTIRPEVADGVNYLLSRVATQGTGRPAALTDGRPQAGKTGTTNGNEAVWYAGYTPELAGVAMIAVDKTNPYFESNPRTVRMTLPVSGTRLQGTGGGDAGKIWQAAMTSAVTDLPKTSFTDPTDEILDGVLVPVPSVRGMGYNEAKATLEAAGFGTRRVDVYSNRRKGNFLGISPTGNAVKFSVIELRVSAGPRPAPPPPPPAAPATTAAPAPAAPPAAPPANNGNGNGNGNNGNGNGNG